MLPRSHRFSPRKEDAFFTKNVHVESNIICAIYCEKTPQSGNTWKAAVVASKKISNSAVIRNMIKRKIRQSLQDTSILKLLNTANSRFVVVAKPGILNLDQKSIITSLQQLLSRQLSRHQ